MLAYKHKRTVLLVSAVLALGVIFLPKITMAAAPPAATCEDDQKKTFLGIFPTWYKYVDDYGPVDTVDSHFGCGFNNHKGGELTAPLTPVEGRTRQHAIQIGLALIDILIRLGGLVAVVYVMMGGYQYMSSMGDPNATKGAMSTLINAAIGLAIVVSAAAIVGFIGNRLGGTVESGGPSSGLNVNPLPRVGLGNDNGLFVSILNFFFGLLAAISFITVVFGGFRYVISRGEPANVAKAKDTILYALIGLVVSFSAFGIVNLLLKVFGS